MSDVQRWGIFCTDWQFDVVPVNDGTYVLAADAEAHEKAAVDAAVANTDREWLNNRGKSLIYIEAIRDCIAAVEALPDGGDADCRYILASASAALRALLEGGE